MRYQPLSERTTIIEIHGWSFVNSDSLRFSGNNVKAHAGLVHQVVLRLDALDDEDYLNLARTMIDHGRHMEQIALRLLDQGMQAEIPLP